MISSVRSPEWSREEDNYLINKYLICYRNKKGFPLTNNNGNNFNRFFTLKDRINAVDYKNIHNFSKYFNEKNVHTNRPFILIDFAKHRAITKEEILEKLNIVLKYNIIQVYFYKKF